MPTGTDYRQQIILALQSQGADQLTIVRDAIRDVEGALATLNQMQADGLGPREYIKALGPLTSELNKLKSLETEITQNLNKEVRDRIDALARQERAAMDLAEAERTAAGDAMRARIDAYARAERAAEQAAAAEREAIGETLRAKIDALARAERAVEAAAKAEQQAIGDAMRARVDAYAREDSRARESNLFRQKLNDDLARSDAELQAALGQAEKARRDRDREADDNLNRIDALGRVARATAEAEAEAERYYAALKKGAQDSSQAEAAAAAVTAAARQKGTEAIADLIAKVREQMSEEEKARVAEIKAMGDRARAHANRETQDEKREQQAKRNAAADAMVGRQAADLSSVIAGLADHERTAATDTDRNTNAVNRQAKAMADAKAHTAGFGSAAEMAADQQKKFSYALLNVSHAAQDAQYGFGAMLNNIPLVTQSVVQAIPKLDTMAAAMGGAAGLAGAFMLVATAANVVYNNWDKVADYFDVGIPRPILDTTEELGRKLKDAQKVTEELGKKTRFTIGEMQQYRDATEEVKKLNAELEKRRDLEDLLSGKSRDQEERGAAFKEAVTESGGGVALDALDTAIGMHADARNLVFNEFRGKNSTPRELAEDMFVAASKGDKRVIDKVGGLLDIAYKPSDTGFAANLRRLSPEGKAAAEKRDADLESQADANLATGPALGKQMKDQRKLDEANRKFFRDLDKMGEKDDIDATKEGARRFGPAVDDELGRSLLRRIGAGQGAQQAAGELAPQVVGRIQGLGASPLYAGEIAAEIVGKAVDKVMSEVHTQAAASGNTPAGAARGLAQLATAKIDQAGQRNQGLINKGVEQEQALGYAKQFQMLTGANQGQAVDAGKRVQALVEKGATVEQAMNQTVVAMTGHLQQVNTGMIRMLASQEAMMGIIGPATQQLAMLNQQARMVNRNVQRARMRGPTLNMMNNGVN